MSAQGRLWVVLPAYNEGAQLVGLVREVAESGPDRHVLVVDDGSDDGCGDEVARAGLERVRVLRHQVNRGLGAGLLTGLEAVMKESGSEDLVAVLDADGTHPISLLDSMVETLRRYEVDVVISSRYRPGSEVHGLTWPRILLSVGSSWVFRLLVPIPGVRDYTCGYRLYRVAALRRARERFGQDLITDSGFTCMAEILVKLAISGARFAEVPLVLRYDRKFTQSKMKVARTVLRTLRLLVKAAIWRWFPSQRPGRLPQAR